MYLRRYLTANENTTSREKLLMHRTLYDLKLAVAQSGHTLLSEEPDVDRDGFDLKLLIATDHLHVQCKTVGPAKGASSWRIRTELLRPRADDVGRCRIDGFNLPHGRGSGLLVARIDLTDEQVQKPGGELRVTYMYLDLMILWALSQGHVRKARDVQADAVALMQGLQGDTSHVVVPRRLLVQAKDPACLAAMMGLEGLYPTTWRSNLGHMWRIESEGASAPRLPTVIVESALAQLRAFSTDLT